MHFDSNGVFTRVMNWTSDQQNGIAIECGRHDQEDDNFAQGFNDTFCRDGRAVATGDFNLGSHKIKNLADGTASTDAVTKGQMDTALSGKATPASITSAINTMLSSLYPVGSVYIGTQGSCPLSTLITGSTWTVVATQVAISVPTSVSVYGNGKNLVLNNGVQNLGLCSNSSGDHTVAPQWTTSTNVSIGASVSSKQATGGSSKAAGVVTNGSLSGLTGNIAPSTYLTVNIWKRTA
jgi:hypothetical protein